MSKRNLAVTLSWPALIVVAAVAYAASKQKPFVTVKKG